VREVNGRVREVNGRVREVNGRVREMNRRIQKIEENETFLKFNPWIDMERTDRTRIQDLRGKCKKRIGSQDWKCMLTGCTVESDLKLAHILPDSCKKLILQRLGLDYRFRNDYLATPWNFMVLRKDIEEAFDALKISFIVKDVLKPREFSLKIWDSSDLSEDIKQMEGTLLSVPSNISLSRRALSYQALMAYLSQKHQEKGFDQDEPADFSSEFEGKDELRKELASIYQTAIREERDEHNFDSDEDEENYVESIEDDDFDEVDVGVDDKVESSGDDK
jgi:hypothetical protein